MSFVLEPNEYLEGIHYKSPFLTCQACNSIAFTKLADICTKINSSFENNPLDNEEHIHPNNCFELCVECSRSNYFQIGAKDLTYTLASSSRELTQKKQTFQKSILFLQKVIRKYQRRQLAKAITRTQVIQREIQNRCATIIQSLFRVITCTKRACVERALLKIKYARPMLVEFALNNDLHKDSVYWFQEEETPVLYFDYYLLKERAGVDLIELEENILRISDRIKKREFYILTLIQTKWRGMNARWFYLIYQRERIHIRENQVSCALKIQKNFWSHTNVISYNKLKCHRYEMSLSKKYEQKMQMKKLRQGRIDARDKVKEMYKSYEQTKRAKFLMTNKKIEDKTSISDTHTDHQFNLVSLNLLKLDRKLRQSHRKIES